MYRGGNVLDTFDWCKIVNSCVHVCVIALRLCGVFGCFWFLRCVCVFWLVCVFFWFSWCVWLFLVCVVCVAVSHLIFLRYISGAELKTSFYKTRTYHTYYILPYDKYVNWQMARFQ